jgi:hypothetical protein
VAKPSEFPELKTSLTDRETKSLRREKATPFLPGAVLVLVLLTFASAFGVFQSVMLVLSPELVESQRNQMISNARVAAMRQGYYAHALSNAQQDLIATMRKFAKFDFWVGIFKLAVTFSLLFTTIACFFRVRWARAPTRWLCLAAAILTFTHYVAMGFGLLWVANSYAGNNQAELIAPLLVALFFCFTTVGIFISGWATLNFPSVRSIFRS